METPGRRISGIDLAWIGILVVAVIGILIPILHRSPSNRPAVEHAMWVLHQRQSFYHSESGTDGQPRNAYWTSDVAGLLRDVPPKLPGLAQADTTRGAAIPYHGYMFRSLPPAKGAYAICAYPAEYGKTGKETFFINGQGLFSKDLGGRILGPGEFVRDGSWSIID